MIHFYRNEKIPEFDFVNKLKLIDENLYVVFDSISMRWHVYFKDKEGGNHLVYIVCDKDHEGRDIKYRPLDDRTINKLLKMDLARRNISATQYKNNVRRAEDERADRIKTQYNNELDYVFKHEKHSLNRAFDALKGVERKY